MRRMYGSLVETPPPIEEPQQPLTPASTSSFVRTVRNFGGLRFSRSVHEGYIEDFIDEEQTLDDHDKEDQSYWSLLLKNSTLFYEFNQTASTEELEIFKALKNAQLHREKRQAGFPGATTKSDNK